MAIKKAADPVRDKFDIDQVYRRLKKWNRNREAELFIIGCNVALRISDLLQLQFAKIREDVKNGSVIGFCDIQEKKTKKAKLVTFSPVAMMAIKRLHDLNPSHVYLFQATGNRLGNRIKPVNPDWINRKFREVAESLELDFNFTSHSMRKTFGFHAYKNGADINVLQGLFNHSSVKETFIYIGITQERISDTYLDFQIEVSV